MHLAHRWYLGYALDEALPDLSSLTHIRQRLGVDVFQRFFEQVVDLCQEAGLVWGRELYVDATKVAANADVDNLIARVNDEVLAVVPNLICILDIETAEPITTEELRYGQRVKVMAVTVPEIMRTPEALDVWGPRRFGFDHDFMPIEAPGR